MGLSCNSVLEHNILWTLLEHILCYVALWNILMWLLLQKLCYFSFLLLDMNVTYMIMKSDKLLNITGYIIAGYIIIKYCIFFYLILKLR